jgi:hypothetical protein
VLVPGGANRSWQNSSTLVGCPELRNVTKRKTLPFLSQARRIDAQSTGIF